jgi:hypothetical protein
VQREQEMPGDITRAVVVCARMHAKPSQKRVASKKI